MDSEASFPALLAAAAEGMTQEQLARELGITQSYLSRILAGLEPGPRTAGRIARRFPQLHTAAAELLLSRV